MALAATNQGLSKSDVSNVLFLSLLDFPRAGHCGKRQTKQKVV